MSLVTWRMTACPEHWQDSSVGEVSAEDDLIIGNGTEPLVFLADRGQL